MIPTDLEARKGDEILPVWERLQAFALSLRLESGGPEVRLFKGPVATVISFDASGTSWDHPFKPTLSVDLVTLAKGTVEGFEATIGGVPISGDAANKIKQPTLKLTADKMNTSSLTSWIALEVTANATGQLTADAKGKLAQGQSVAVTHVAAITNNQAATSASGVAVGMAALALVTWADKKPTGIFPIIHHNLNYARTFPNEAQGAARHFFWAI